ncbi:MAG: MotA/TolQ/ExbB proton channel family protein [Candidatus Omnitrophica bacterium]|nr:MotA/TolQ/ExbB proton channel family protein [Candidatus Omnitrophota bacterium]
MNGEMGEMNFWKVIFLGGPIMVPILLCSFFALAIIIEKMLYFHSIKTNILELKTKIFNLIKTNKIPDAILLCETANSPIAKILKAGLGKFGSSKEEITQSIEEVSLFEIPKLESRLGALSTIAQITPLLGLLGTVTGMVICFHTIEVKSAALSPVTIEDLAGGIGQALITTAAGLIVAIPALTFYNYYVNRVNHFVLDMERTATELVNFICQITGTSN